MVARIALRNMSRQSRRSLLLGGAVAFAVMMTTLSASFSAGMLSAMQDNLSLSLGGHLSVSGGVRSRSGRLQSRMSDYGALEGLVVGAAPGVVRTGRRVAVNASLVFGSGETRQRVSGVEWDRDRLYRDELKLVEGSFDALSAPRSLLLDSDTCARLGSGLGDELLARFATASGQQNVVSFRIAAVYDSRSASGQTGALASFEELRGDLNMGEGEFQSLVLTLEDLGKAEESARLVEAALRDRGMLAASEESEGLRVTTVMDLMGELTTVLATVRWISAIVLVLMLSLSAAGIANTYRMVLLERTREIGAMRCLGMQRGEVLALMVAEAEGVTLCGALVGELAGLVAGALVAAIPLNLAGSAAMMLRQGRALMIPDPASMALTLAAVLLMGLLASWPAARRAAALEPAEALGRHG